MQLDSHGAQQSKAARTYVGILFYSTIQLDMQELRYSPEIQQELCLEV